MTAGDLLSIAPSFLILILYWAIVPASVGLLTVKALLPHRNVGNVETYIWGNVTLWAVWEILTIPMAFLRMPFHVLFWIFLTLVLMAVLVSLLSYRTELIERFKRIPAALKSLPWFAWVVFALIIGQILVYVFGQIMSDWDGDDAFYLAQAMMARYQDVLVGYDYESGFELEGIDYHYDLTGWGRYLAFLSKIAFIHPTIFAHTVLPIFLVFTAWCVYYLIVGRLFKERIHQFFYLFIFFAILAFGAYSAYTLTFRLDITIWQGKGVMVSIMYPFIIYFCLLQDDKFDFRYAIAALLLMLATMNASLMGLGFVPILFIGLTLARISVRDWKKIIALIILTVVAFALYLLYIEVGPYTSKLLTKEYYIRVLPQQWEVVKASYAYYWNGSKVEYLFYACIALLFVLRKRIELGKTLVRFLFWEFFLTFNPVVFCVLAPLFRHINTYVRAWYLLFPEIIMASALTALVVLIYEKNKIIGFVSTCVAAVPAIYLGASFQSLAEFGRAENLYKIPNEAIDVAEVILETGVEESTLVTDLDISRFVRLYDSSIKTYWSRGAFKPCDEYECVQIYYDVALKDNGFVVTNSDATERKLFEDTGAKVLATFDDLVVYDTIYRHLVDGLDDVYSETYGTDGRIAVYPSREGYNFKYYRNADFKIIYQIFCDYIGKPIYYQGRSFVTTEFCYDERGNIVKETFRDDKSNVVPREGTQIAHFGYEYDKDNHLIANTYYDQFNNPAMIMNSYHKEKLEYDESFCHCIAKSYYDVGDQPIMRADHGYFRCEDVLNDGGYIIDRKYFDTENSLVNTADGYAEERWLYNDDNREIRYEVYDKNGKPILNSDGWFVRVKEYDGNVISSEKYFDIEGNEVMSK